MSLQMIWGRQRLAPLGRIVILGLIGFALCFIILMLLPALFILPLFILALISLVIAALVATGIRWIPALGVVYCIITMIFGVITNPYLPYHLTHPGEVGPFIASLFSYVCGVIVIGAGLGAIAQNYRNSERRAPRWLATPLTGAAGFLLGALLVSLLVAGTSATPGGATTVNGVPAVHMGLTGFIQPTITITKGSRLALVDDGQFTHILANGQWINNTPHTQAEAGAPEVQHITINGGSTEIGPFNAAGTFHILCTIHQGMELIIVVQ